MPPTFFFRNGFLNFDLNRPKLSGRFYRVGKTVDYHIVVVVVAAAVAEAAAIAAVAVVADVVAAEAFARRHGHRGHKLVGRSARRNVNSTEGHFFGGKVKEYNEPINLGLRVKEFSPPETFSRFFRTFCEKLFSPTAPKLDRKRSWQLDRNKIFGCFREKLLSLTPKFDFFGRTNARAKTSRKRPDSCFLRSRSECPGKYGQGRSFKALTTCNLESFHQTSMWRYLSFEILSPQVMRS